MNVRHVVLLLLCTLPAWAGPAKDAEIKRLAEEFGRQAKSLAASDTAGIQAAARAFEDAGRTPAERRLRLDALEKPWLGGDHLPWPAEDWVNWRQIENSPDESHAVEYWARFLPEEKGGKVPNWGGRSAKSTLKDASGQLLSARAVEMCRAFRAKNGWVADTVEIMAERMNAALASGRLDDLVPLGRPGEFINGPGESDEPAKDSSVQELVAWLKETAKGAPLKVKPIAFGWKPCGRALAIVRAADGGSLAELIFCPDAGGAAWVGYLPSEQPSEE